MKKRILDNNGNPQRTLYGNSNTTSPVLATNIQKTKHAHEVAHLGNLR